MKNKYQILNDLDERLNLDWEDLFSKYVGEKFIKRGNTHFINCPFHGENTASFGISFQKKVMKCFGCGKFYKNILQFLCDHLMLSTQGLIETLINDGYINESDLGSELDGYLLHNVKKEIYKVIENRFSDKEPIFQRLLYFNGGIGKITDEKIKNIEALIEKKYKKDEKLKEIAQEILKGIKENDGNYGLIQNEYNSISFYSGKKGSKAINFLNENIDIKYVYNDIVNTRIREIKKEAGILNMLLQNSNQDLLKNWKKTKITGLTKKAFTGYLENKNIDSKAFGDLLINFFFKKSYDINYYVGEGYFDVVNFGIFGLPYYTNGSSISDKKINKFIKMVNKKTKNDGDTANINLVFDNDKPGYLCSIKFVNQFLKEVKNGNLKESDVTLQIFDFENFVFGIRKLFSVVSVLSKKTNEENILPYIEEIKKIHKTYDSFYSEVKGNTGFSNVFGDIETDMQIINKIKIKYLFNYDETSKWNFTIKDTGELPMLFFGLQLMIQKIKGTIKSKEHAEDFELLKEIIIGEFKNIYNFSFKSVLEFKEKIQTKISSDFIKKSDLAFLNGDDYIFSETRVFGKKHIELAISSSINKLASKIDVNLSSLLLLNQLCYLNELKMYNMSDFQGLKSVRLQLKPIIAELLPNKFELYFNEMLKNEKIKTKGDEEIKIKKRNDLLMKNLLIINLWKGYINSSSEDLKRIILEKMNIKEGEIVEILNGNKDFINKEEVVALDQIFEHYDVVSDILKQKIIDDIRINSEQENLIEKSTYQYAYSFLLRNE